MLSSWLEAESVSYRNQPKENSCEYNMGRTLSVNDQEPNKSGLDKLEEMGIISESVPPEAWDNIAGLTNEKALIEGSIVLPLQHPDLAIKHGVATPRAILLFGPPGTGKTFFAKGIAGRLKWSFIEVSPSSLIDEGIEKQALKLKQLFEIAVGVKRAVIFFDEFEELALRPDTGSEREKLVSSEMLRQIPRLKEATELLLICATNNIRLLNPALLRPGRFDYILPIGPLDAESRRAIFRMYLGRMNAGVIDLDTVSAKSRYYTAADIQTVCERAALAAFQREIERAADQKVSTQDLLQAIETHRPTTDPDKLQEFKEDIMRFCRAEHCPLLLEPFQ